MAIHNTENIQNKYKKLLMDAYKVSKTDQSESQRLYAEADELRKLVFAF